MPKAKRTKGGMTVESIKLPYKPYTGETGMHVRGSYDCANLETDGPGNQADHQAGAPDKSGNSNPMERH